MLKRSITFRNANHEQVELEIINAMPLARAPPKMKYLDINITKQVQDLCKENYQTLIKEIKEELNKWSAIHIHVDKKTQYCTTCQFFPTLSIDSM